MGFGKPSRSLGHAIHALAGLRPAPLGQATSEPGISGWVVMSEGIRRRDHRLGIEPVPKWLPPAAALVVHPTKLEMLVAMPIGTPRMRDVLEDARRCRTVVGSKAQAWTHSERLGAKLEEGQIDDGALPGDDHAGREHGEAVIDQLKYFALFALVDIVTCGRADPDLQDLMMRRIDECLAGVGQEIEAIKGR